MIKYGLQINQRVEIEVPSKDACGGCYSSRVEDLFPDKVVLAAPIKNNKIVPLKRGEVIKIKYWGGSAGYSFTTRILQRRGGRIPTITVELPEKIRRWQRRNYLRISANLPLTFTLTSSDGNIKYPQIYHTETIDISGGGVMIKSPLLIEKDSYLELELTLPQRGIIVALGRIVRAQKRASRNKHFYLLGIEFSVINESDREKIIAYVFELQRQRNRRRLF